MQPATDHLRSSAGPVGGVMPVDPAAVETCERPSGRAAVVIAEQPAEALTASDYTDVRADARLGVDQLVLDPLVIALDPMMVS